ncbi:MAG: phosphotransferase [Chloroflexota bacterium]
MLTHWNERGLADLLADHDLGGLGDRGEMAFPNDGWSGATLSQFQRGSERFILKRTSWAVDWIARATRDHALREGFVATGQLPLPPTVVAPYLGAAADGTEVGMLMPDLSHDLLVWERPDGAPTVDAATLDRVLAAVAALHATPLSDELVAAWPWCPLRERLLLLSPGSASQFEADGVAAGTRFRAGWEAFGERAPRAANELVARLDEDPAPLLTALATLPPALLHGDLKVANVAPLPDGRTAFIDWQMVMVAPVAVDLGWLLVANSSAFAEAPDDVLARYVAIAASSSPAIRDGWPVTRDLALITGLLLRGWRKGLDAAAGGRLASGIAAVDDLAWWGASAVEAADRRL